MLEKIAKWLTRKPKLVAMMAVLMLIPAAIGYISTRINYDILSYLPEDLESSHGEKLLEEPFKMAATSMLVVESMPAGYTNSLLNDIKAIDGVSNAIWISNLMGIQIPTDMIPANFRDMFFAGDATMMIIQYSHPGASDETMEAIEQVRRACNEKCFLAGFSVVIKDTRDLMDSELPIFVGLAVLLALRGYADPMQARAFLSGGDQSAFDPMLLQDMDKAVARIRTAIERRENVAVFGDYDVDGITSTCVLTDYLRRQGVPVHPYIPDRIEEGYGLNMDAITNLQRTSDITLIITVDCGITAIDETNYALQRGIDMVITDHHECSGQAIPNAVAVVDPKRPGSQYPNSGLAGVGVAYKLLCALEDGSDRVLREYGDLVAIGTVADVMPLTGENRYLVAQGLAQINARPRPGIRALLHECGAEGRPVTATTIGFTLAPRINAAGRLGKTAVAALLLLTNDDGEADRYAAGLCQLNRERQALEQQIWEEASAIACRYPPRMPLVLASDSWHQGVIGIAASRLSEEFHLPTIMICCDGERGKGSCRSFGGFNLYNALSACSEYLEGFGGHALAAGLTIRRENIDRFRRALGEYYRQNPADDLPELTCDLRVNDPHLLTMPCIESLDALEPCGNGNPKPLLCITGARLVNAVPIGGGRHLRLHFAKGGYNYAGIFFSCTPAQLGVRIGQWVDVAFTPQINEFRGRRSVQLLVTDVRPSDPLPLCRALLKNQCIPAWDTVDLYPLRADFAVAWRWLNAPVAFPLEELPARAPMRPEKFCVCLRVMAEMGLAAVDFDGETLRLRPLPTSGKVDLGASKLLQTLRERRQSLL